MHALGCGMSVSGRQWRSSSSHLQGTGGNQNIPVCCICMPYHEAVLILLATYQISEL